MYGLVGIGDAIRVATLATWKDLPVCRFTIAPEIQPSYGVYLRRSDEGPPDHISDPIFCVRRGSRGDEDSIETRNLTGPIGGVSTKPGELRSQRPKTKLTEPGEAEPFARCRDGSHWQTLAWPRLSRRDPNEMESAAGTVASGWPEMSVP